MQRVAIIGTHGISEHEPLAHSETLAKGAASFLKSQLALDSAVELGYEQLSDTILLRDLPAPYFTVSGSTDENTKFEIDIYEANWSKHTKRNASIFTTIRRLYALCSTLNRSYRVFSRKFAIELVTLAGSVVLVTLSILLPIYALLRASNVIAAHVTAPQYPLIPLAVGVLAVLGVLPTLTWFCNIALGMASLRTRKITFQYVWQDGKSRGVPHFERFFTCLSASLSAPGNANQVFSVLKGFAAMCIFVVCATVITLAMIYFHSKGTGPLTPDEAHVVVLGILVGQFFPRILDNINNLLVPFEDIYAFSHSKARLQTESGSLEAFTCVAEKIRSVLRQRDRCDKPKYDTVLVVGHSLGSFVALQAIELVERAGLHGAIARDDLERLKSFVSYGSAIDKVWGYLRLNSPSKNLLADLPWFRANKIFCPASRPREGAIRWANVWYSTDLVGDRISVVTDCCTNLHPRSPLVPWSHSHYLKDPAFWHTALFETFGTTLGLSSPYADPEIAETVNSIDLLKKPFKISWTRLAVFIAMTLGGLRACGWLVGHNHLYLGLVAPLIASVLPFLLFRDQCERINLSRLRPKRNGRSFIKWIDELMHTLRKITGRLYKQSIKPL